MKTERRHELQKNDLADYLGKHLLVIQPYLKWIGIGAVVVVLLLLVASIVSRRSQTTVARAWEEYLEAETLEDSRRVLEEVALIYENNPAGWWALQSKAYSALNEGSFLVYSDREEAEALLKQAISDFNQVIDRARGIPYLEQRAYYGLGLAHETLGELKDAQEAYEKVIASDASSALAQQARERIARLEKRDVREFYAWFVEQKPVVPDTSAAPGGLPSELPQLPEFPDLGFPSAPTGEPPATPLPPSESLPDDPSAQESPDEEPAADEPASEEPPAVEPATEEPAAEEPAAEEPAVEETATDDAATEEPVEEPSTEESGVEEPAQP